MNSIGRLGVEIELLAPRGRSREDLANAIAKHFGGRVRRFFHPQGEQSKAANTPFFENLTLGFVVENKQGEVLAQCVDDFTLQDDLDQKHPPREGWYRIVSDDVRFLRLTMLHANASEPLETVLQPMADLFRVEAMKGAGGMIRVADTTGAPIVLGATLPGERERPCELVTAPMDSNHLEQLETMLRLAKSLDFTIPAEGATHLHFDGTRLCKASAIANLVRFLDFYGESLKDLVGTNPRCRRLGAWAPELLELVNNPLFVDLEWEEAKLNLKEAKLTKFCDFNLRNLVYKTPGKHTFEVRILPVWMEAQRIVDVAGWFAAILDWACDDDGKLKAIPDELGNVVTGLPDPSAR